MHHRRKFFFQSLVPNPNPFKSGYKLYFEDETLKALVPCTVVLKWEKRAWPNRKDTPTSPLLLQLNAFCFKTYFYTQLKVELVLFSNVLIPKVCVHQRFQCMKRGCGITERTHPLPPHLVPHYFRNNIFVLPTQSTGMSYIFKCSPAKIWYLNSGKVSKKI